MLHLYQFLALLSALTWSAIAGYLVVAFVRGAIAWVRQLLALRRRNAAVARVVIKLAAAKACRMRN